MAGNDDVQLLVLAEAPTIPVSDAVPDWTPIRRLLDVQAFGINLWTARHAGDIAIEEHDETGPDGGQEELYLVLRGAARFTVGDEVIEASAGSLVYIREPTLRRTAIALEDDTATLAVGGRRGAFTPSAWETRWVGELGAADQLGE